MKRTFAFLTAVCLVAALATSCTEPFAGGDAQLSISFAGPRTAIAQLTASVDEISVTMTSQDGYASRSGSGAPGNTMVIDAPAGTWDIAATALLSGKVVGTGSSNGFVLAAGDSKTLSLAISFFQDTGTGSISLEIRFPDSLGIDYVSGSIASQSLTPSVVASAESGYSAATFSASGIPVGNANDLVFTLRRGGAAGTIAGTFREAVNVWRDITSGQWIDSTSTLTAYRKILASELLDANASLSGLTFTDLDFPPGSPFSSSETTYPYAGDTYPAAIKSPVASVSFTPYESIAGQRFDYSFNGGGWVMAYHGIASSGLDLADTPRLLEIKVTALDQSEKIYSIKLVKAYSIRYSSLGAESGAIPAGANLYVTGETATIVGNTGGLARNGCSFGGWSTEPDGKGTLYTAGTSIAMPLGGITLYPVWVGPGIGRVWLKVAYASWTTASIQNATVAHGSTIVISPIESGLLSLTNWKWYVDGIAVTDGATFSGSTTSALTWNTQTSTVGHHVVSAEVNNHGLLISGSAPIEVTASAGSKCYSVSYSAKGSTGGAAPMDDALYASGETVALPDMGTLVRAEWKFMGWLDNPTGSGTIYATGSTYPISSNVCFYPYWIPFDGGSGTLADPYLVANAYDLNAVRGYLTSNFKQTADIDLSGYENWVPIGSGAFPFCGSYIADIAYRSVTNLKINLPTSDYVGLFGFITGASLQGIVVSGNVTGNMYVGVLLGSGTTISITMCGSSGSAVGGTRVGGLAGSASNVTRCYSTASVSGVTSLGGLLGEGGGITHCYASGSVSGSGDSYQIAGLAGYSVGDPIAYCYSTGALSGSSGGQGFSGYTGTTCTECYWDSATSLAATNYVSGPIAKTTAEMQAAATFVNWVASGYWTIMDGAYPVLGWQP